MITDIHHIAIIVSNKEKAIEFYQNALGFKLTRSYVRPERQDEVMFFEGHGAVLEIFVTKAPQRLSDPEANGLRHLAIRTDDIEGDAARLKDLGYTLDYIREDTLSGGRLIFVFDPDGLPIELHE